MSEQPTANAQPEDVGALRWVHEVVRLWEHMTPTARREAVRQLQNTYCLECGVVHGDECTCFKGWESCHAPSG